MVPPICIESAWLHHFRFFAALTDSLSIAYFYLFFALSVADSIFFGSSRICGKAIAM